MYVFLKTKFLEIYDHFSYSEKLPQMPSDHPNNTGTE